ncbi:hypothetical protein LTR37_019692 [Vermiconidia calcicola]|uniref:Uncharacterized protein n=1 Tax=Vermiconidia calcicola TaxID=1690605 RepID=A0ACC3MDF6_9PEZI|nr:hypothetical protein LTR37_019692 [Vermiconidia calcicola]
MAHAYYAEMGGFMLQAPDAPACSITAKHLLYLVNKKYTNLPAIIEKEIWDKSKADLVLKALALVQVSWLVVQVVARAVQGLTISLLDISACGVIACWAPTMVFWFRKPLDVYLPNTISIKTPMETVLKNAGDVAKKPFRQTPLDFVEDVDQTSRLFTCLLPDSFLRNHPLSPSHRPLQRLPNDRDAWYHSVTTHVLIATPFYLLASLNFAAWHTIFPTYAEKALWRCSAAVYLISTILWGSFELIIQACEGSKQSALAPLDYDKFKFPIALFFWIPVLVAFVARICLIGETLVSLRAMPADVYHSVAWTNFIPHV